MKVNLKTTDTGTAALQELRKALSRQTVARAVGSACVRLTQRHLLALPPNKNGWPSQGFYRGAARGTYWEPTGNGVTIFCENEAHPGAMNQRYHGGTIAAKDKRLTIPARQEFYGKSARDFSNLRLVVFGHTGVAALVVGEGGTEVRGKRGGFVRGKGLGVRAQSVVAYWLKDSVDQQADPSVLPTNAQYQATATTAVLEAVRKVEGVKG